MDNNNLFSNNKVFFLANPDEYLLAVLNSPLMWRHNWRYLPHMINDTLTPVGELMETLPIAPPTDDLRAYTEQAVTRLIKITRTGHETQRLMLDWLRGEFGVQEPGKRLENIAELDIQAFIDEVGKRRTKTAKKLTPAARRFLQDGYVEQVLPWQQDQTEAKLLEHRVSDLINSAYGLTSEEIALLWATTPPRMPLRKLYN